MEAVLFDMDGVLVDVSQSYRRTIQKVVQDYTKSDFPLAHVQAFKDRGGWNDDWELTRHILKNRGLDVDKGEVVRCFQKIYLGEKYDGFIQNERWLLERGNLKEISAVCRTGIVTGRPRLEARYVLRRFQVESYFRVLVTMDDLPAGRGKPDPMGIKKALEMLGCCRGFYLGDTLDDMKAAAGAGIKPIGVVNPAADRHVQETLLIRHGALRVLQSANQFMEVLNEKASNSHTENQRNRY